MTARQEILEVARELTARGAAPFSPAQVITELQRRGTSYRTTTLRTHITDIMCADSPSERAGSYADLRRVGRGQYVLAQAHPRPSEQPDRDVVVAAQPERAWHWEGNVQHLFAGYLRREGWRILQSADTASRAQGPDLVAVRGERRLVVEVKGYPESQKASVNTQARHYVGGALLTALLAWADNRTSSIGLVFPDKPTYRKLAGRLADPLEELGIALWLVTEAGSVDAVVALSE